MQEVERTGVPLRTNPDGDVSSIHISCIMKILSGSVTKVAIEHLKLSYTDFVVPECPACAMDGHRNSQVSHTFMITFLSILL
jgi:NAD-dependent deacetylase sirtuin 4